MDGNTTRRKFLGQAGGLAAVSVLPRPARGQDKNSRLEFGMIGCGGKAKDLARSASHFGDFVACCDVDVSRFEPFLDAASSKGPVARFKDYRELLAEAKVDAVLVATPDHWHTRIFADALRAGKPVYGEKPMTLTIDEGKVLCRVVRETGGVLQVGAQQRSAPWFRQAVALVRGGYLGSPVAATCQLGAGNAGGPFAEAPVPEGLDWDSWLGQAPRTPYIPQRCHGTFRWWYEYSGGKLTDWGAHHIDIAQWALGAEHTGPVSVEGTGVLDSRPNCYNTAKTFECRLQFANGNVLRTTDKGENGIRFEGERGTIFVSRTAFEVNIPEGMPPKDQLEAEAAGLYAGPMAYEDTEMGMPGGSPSASWDKVKWNHMGNFVRCIASGGTPISDVETMHRTVSSCHLCNIAIRLGRSLNWDPIREDFIGDAEASAMVKRNQREPFTIG